MMLRRGILAVCFFLECFELFAVGKNENQFTGGVVEFVTGTEPRQNTTNSPVSTPQEPKSLEISEETSRNETSADEFEPGSSPSFTPPPSANVSTASSKKGSKFIGFLRKVLERIFNETISIADTEKRFNHSPHLQSQNEIPPVRPTKSVVEGKFPWWAWFGIAGVAALTAIGTAIGLACTMIGKQDTENTSTSTPQRSWWRRNSFSGRNVSSSNDRNSVSEHAGGRYQSVSLLSCR